MLISSAFAADLPAATPPMSDWFGSLVPLVLIVVIFYFMLIRPQQKRMQAHQQMLTQLKRGDSVVTQAGILGTIHKIEEKDSIVVLEIAPEVRIRVTRASIAEMGKE